MAHTHVVHDVDSFFAIDPITKIITAGASDTHLVQYDHNSETITFKIPKEIEGHDMSLCDRVEVHFVNRSNGTSVGNRTNNEGIWAIQDLVVWDEDPEFLVGTWPVSQDATLLNGTLQFKLKFICHDTEEIPGYILNTVTFTGLVVTESFDCSSVIVEKNSDVILEFDRRISALEEGGGAVGKDGLSAYEIWLQQGNEGTEAEFLESLKGEDGADGENGLSAYEIWLQQGNEGSEADFLESLKGEDGATGQNGEDGASITVVSVIESDIDSGENIITFSDGNTLTVKNGSQGEKGDPGADGNPGQDGAQGVSGVYVGSGEMPEGYNVQIDPDGDVTVDLLAEIDAALAEAKAYTDEELAEFDFIKVVDALPDEGLPNKVYLVPKTDTQTQDLFDEYVWVNKGTTEAPEYAWEWVTTKRLEVDLTNYTTLDKVEELILERSKKDHQVGSLYLSMVSTNPADIFGFGTWTLIAQNRFPIGAGDKYAAGATGGSETHAHDVAFRFASYYNEVVLENHEATGIVSYAENGTKTATGNIRVGYTAADSENNYYNAGTEVGKAESGQMGIYETVGNTSYESSLPPYIAMYIWQRTA